MRARTTYLSTQNADSHSTQILCCSVYSLTSFSAPVFVFRCCLLQGVPRFLDSPTSIGSLDSIIDPATNTTTGSDGNSTIITTPIATGGGPVNSTAVKCLLSNAAAVITTVVVNTTTVITTSTTMVSGPVPSSSYSTVSTILSTFSWTTLLDYNVTYLRNLTNAQIMALSASYKVSPARLSDMVNGTQPFLIDSLESFPILGGRSVNPVTGAVFDVPQGAAMMLVVPASNPLLPPALVATSVWDAGMASFNLPQAAKGASQGVFLLDGSGHTHQPIITPITQQTTVVSSQLVTTTSPVQSALDSSLIVKLSNGIRMGLHVTGTTAQSLSTVPLQALTWNPNNVTPLTYTNNSIPISLVALIPTIACINSTTGALYNSVVPASMQITLPYTTAVVDLGHTADSYVLASAALAAPLVLSSDKYNYNLPNLPYTSAVQHVFKSVGFDPAAPTIVLSVTHSETITEADFSDVSVQSVFGNVYIGPNVLLPGIEICGMPNVIVTVYSADDLLFATPLAVSLLTDNFGGFSITVPIGEPVVLVPSYVNTSIQHEFYPSSFQVIGGVTPLYGVSFYDIQLQNLTLSIVGGLCEASIVPGVNPLLIVDSCGTSAQWPLSAFSKLANTYELPAIAAHVLSYAGLPTTGVKFDAANGMTPGYQLQLNSWLLNNGQLVMDLTAGNQQQQFVYFNTTQVALAAPLLKLPCMDASSHQQFTIWSQSSANTIVFHLSQQYGYGTFAAANLCQQVDPSIGVFVKDQVSDDDTQECVVNGCTLPTTHYDGTYTTTNYSTYVGQPYIFQRVGAPDYTTDILYGIAGSLQPEANTLHVLITGTIITQGLGSVPLAPHQPQYILRDPVLIQSHHCPCALLILHGVLADPNGCLIAVRVCAAWRQLVCDNQLAECDDRCVHDQRER